MITRELSERLAAYLDNVPRATCVAGRVGSSLVLLGDHCNESYELAPGQNAANACKSAGGCGIIVW